MTRGLFFYAWRSARNQAVKRAKDPRYLIGIVLVAAYLYLVLGPGGRPPHVRGSQEALSAALLTLLLVAVSLLTWFLPGRDHPLALNRGEAQLLVPAPLTSRQLMLFKVLISQPTLIWSALLVSLLLRNTLSSHLLVRFAAAYIVLLALYGQRLGVALTRNSAATSSSRLKSAAVAGVRVWLAAAFVIALGQVGTDATRSGLLDLQRWGIPVSWAYELPWATVVLPFRALVASAFATSGAEMVASFSAAVLLLVVEFALVFRSSPDWERVGIVRTTEEWRRGKRPGEQTRAVDGSMWERTISSVLKTPAAAIAWKNLVTGGRTQPLTPQVAMVLGIPVLLAATLAPALRNFTSFASGMACAWAALLLFAGPVFVRNDLRLDLPKLRLLRTYPLVSREICVAEVGSSTVVLTLLQVTLLALSTLALIVNPVIPGSPAEKITWAVALAVLLPGMNAINVSSQNVFALLFPRWVSLGMVRPSRTANPGQYYISLLISAGLFLVGMILPAIGALGVAYQIWQLSPGASLVSGALVAGAIALGEAALVIAWMARLLDRVDPALVTAQ